MSTENTPVESQEDDLDTFSAEFFGQKTAPKEPASSEEKDEDDLEDSDAPTKDTQDGEDDTPATDDDADEDDAEDEDQDNDEDEPEPEPKPKKSRAQERIEELNAKFRETERQLNELRAKFEQKAEPAPAPKAEVSNTGPTPEDKNEDGSDKYELGEFDPQYIRDLTRHTLQTEREALKIQEQADAEQQVMTQQRAELQASWEQKLGPAQERYPDFLEKGEALISQFDGLDQGYGEYLTSTLMSMEYGPDVLYYLSNNQDEAKAIVNSGAAKATIALGRLEAKFAFANEEKQKARPKVSKAPTPPAHMNKGSAAAIADVPADTDDLEAFANEFFSKKKRRS